MSYSFLQELEEIKEFYDKGRTHFGSMPDQARALTTNSSLQNPVVQFVAQKSKSFSHLLKKMVPVMICTVWESFIIELRNIDPTRFQTHFSMPNQKWYNEPMREVALIRHCICHQNGIIDQQYLRDSRIKTFSVIGTTIDFTEPELDLQFTVFEDAYNQIMQ